MSSTRFRPHRQPKRSAIPGALHWDAGRRGLGLQASSLAGWDVVSPEECLLSNSTWRLLTAAGPPGKKLGARFVIQTGQVLQQRDKPCRQFFVLLEVRPRW